MFDRIRVALRWSPAAVLILAAACADTTSPSVAPSRFRAPSALHDDPPPDMTCRTGWMLVDGRWVCPE
jgi:hypothetical protein